MKTLQDYLEAFDELNYPYEYGKEIKQFLSDTIKEVTGEMVVEEDTTPDADEYERADRMAWNACVREQSARRDEILGGGTK